MSLVSIESPKHCAKKGLNVHKLSKKLFFAFSAFFTTLLSLILIIWLILRPTKPEFSLKETDIYQLSLSNPNQKVGIYYDELQVYAAYKGQQITVDSPLPPFYQGHQDSNLLTASLVGAGLPVAPSFNYEVGRDQTAGKLVLNLRVNGRIRWKVGTWVSGRYRINVSCLAVMALGSTLPTGPLRSTQGTACSTAV
ncbi:NDR1/HIN1 protein [Salix suchowensis]|nr:NDR1/HIN1 protein [Salix suchowensis]